MLQDLWQRTIVMLPAYVPNLAAAVTILIVGWLGALVAAALVRGALRRTTLDNRLADWLAGEKGAKVEVERAAGRIT